MACFRVDDEIGVYRIVRPLGEGGMGAVYEVEHTKLGVHYALKTFSLTDEEYADILKNKFLAEGKVLARLHDPNIVRVFDLNYDEATRTPYFVMDLVLYKDGEPHTLADVETSDLEETYIRQWFVELAAALDYIHAQGIVHRDIKLSNVLLAADKHVILSDFGVSRFFSQNLRRQVSAVQTMVSAATNSRLVMGTQGYMAPEVERGEEATPAADSYSFAVMIVYLLTGVWYEPGSKVLQLLDTFALPWGKVLPPMLAEDPKARPTNLSALARKLGTPVTEAETVIRPGGSSSDGRARTPGAPQSLQNENALGDDCGAAGIRALPAGRRNRAIMIAAGALIAIGIIVAVIVGTSRDGGAPTPGAPQSPQNEDALGVDSGAAGIRALPLTDGEFKSFFSSDGVYEVLK